MAAERADVRPGLQLGSLRRIRVRDYALRFVFGAVISVGAALIGQVGGPRLGGMFLAFPAILPAGLTLIQEEDGTRDADRTAVGAILGGIALCAFAIVGEAAFGTLPPWLVLLLALGAWCGAAIGLYAVLAVLRPEACDRNRD